MADSQSCHIIQQCVGLIDTLTDDRFSGTWRTVEFPTPFSPNVNHVVVLAMSQTHEGPDTPGLRIRNVTYSSFEIRYDEVIWHNATGAAQGSQGRHPRPEIVGWVAYGY